MRARRMPTCLKLTFNIVVNACDASMNGNKHNKRVVAEAKACDTRSSTPPNNRTFALERSIGTFNNRRRIRPTGTDDGQAFESWLLHYRHKVFREIVVQKEHKQTRHPDLGQAPKRTHTLGLPIFGVLAHDATGAKFQSNSQAR